MSIRPRFSLRLLLVFVTVAGIATGVARVYFSPRGITELDAQVIEVGHSQWQVRYTLGPPHHVYQSANLTKWGYDFDGTFDYFDIDFRDGRVVETNRRSYLPFVSER